MPRVFLDPTHETYTMGTFSFVELLLTTRTCRRQRSTDTVQKASSLQRCCIALWACLVKLVVGWERFLWLSVVLFGTSLVIAGCIGLGLTIVVLRLRLPLILFSALLWIVTNAALGVVAVVRFLVHVSIFGKKLAWNRNTESRAKGVYERAWMTVRAVPPRPVRHKRVHLHRGTLCTNRHQSCTVQSLQY
jgi:hypothetical protein